MDLNSADLDLGDLESAMTLPLGSIELQELDMQVKAAVAANSEEAVVAAAASDPPLRQQESLADWEPA